eukprot:2359649-Pleurochrysis_carterae.AAC.4
MDGCGDYMSILAALLRVGCSGKRCGEAVDLKQVDQVAAATWVDAEVNAFCSSRCGLAWILCFAAKVTGCAAEQRAELVNVSEAACRSPSRRTSCAR